MVWKDNFLVGSVPTTMDAFLYRHTRLGLELSFAGDPISQFSLYYSKHPKDVFHLRFYLDEKHFPRHLVFGNFHCLRCGLCCRNYECVPVLGEQVEKWISEDREDILKRVWHIQLPGGHVKAEIVDGWLGCPLCRKVRGKPYYYCRIEDAKAFLPICKAYVCSKSIPVAHLNYRDIEELIEVIGLDAYYALIERDWGEEFDYSNCPRKTHRNR